MNLACAAGIGAVSGLRSMSGPAVVSEAANRNRNLHVNRTPFAWLGSGGAARTLGFMALGEMIADKLPFMPNRTAPPSLAFRAASGAFCGYTVCGKRWPGKRAWIGAAVGAAAAVATSYAGFEYRKRAPLPPLLAALLEDAVAVGVGSAVLSSIGR